MPLLELMLQSAARPDPRDAAGRTPLHYAVLHGRPEVCGRKCCRFLSVFLHDKDWTVSKAARAC